MDAFFKSPARAGPEQAGRERARINLQESGADTCPDRAGPVGVAPILPSGKVTEIKDLKPDRLYTIDEDAGGRS